MSVDPATDEGWAEYARVSREALIVLGFNIMPRCLPDEAEPCGGTFSEHVMAQLATIKAVCDHQLAHLGAPPGQAEQIYRAQLANLEAAETGCQGVTPQWLA